MIYSYGQINDQVLDVAKRIRFQANRTVTKAEFDVTTSFSSFAMPEPLVNAGMKEAHTSDVKEVALSLILISTFTSH